MEFKPRHVLAGIVAGLAIVTAVLPAVASAYPGRVTATHVGASDPFYSWHFKLETATGENEPHEIAVSDQGTAVLVTDSAGLIAAGECSSIDANTVSCPVELSARSEFDVLTMSYELGDGSDVLDLTGLPDLPGSDSNADPNTCCGPSYAEAYMHGGHDQLLNAHADLYGGLDAGADLMRGGDGHDGAGGGPGNDRLFGADGRDRLYGEGGSDFLHGGASRDWLHGGTGNDRLNSRDGLPDYMTCGKGKRRKQSAKRDRVERRFPRGFGRPPLRINCR
jgi:hypothetical protein